MVGMDTCVIGDVVLSRFASGLKVSFWFREVAPAVGLEPTTCCLGVNRSIP